jgi:uncharacterized membrane-anchored protein YitT (DUF2179 family)
MASVNKRKRICIVSDRSEEIRAYIVETLERGCTLYDVHGGHTGDPHVEIQALLTQDEFSHVMDFVKKHDIHAFITAGNVSEVYGMWNKTKHKKVEK